MTPVEVFRQRIVEKKNELDRMREEQALLDKRVFELQTAMAAWQEALSLLVEAPADTRKDTPALAEATTSPPQRAKGVRRRGPRGPKGIWAAIITRMRIDHGSKEFGVDDAISSAAGIGQAVKRDTARGQMASYVKSGILMRIRDGRFRFANSAQAKFAIKEESASGLSLKPDAHSDQEGHDPA